MTRVLAETYAALTAASTPEDKWSALTAGLADIGLDQINYAFLDLGAFGRMEARGDPSMSTMRRDWIEHYAGRRYDIEDDIVAHVRTGRFDPKFYRLSRPDHFRQREIAEEAREAGLRSGLLIPLPGPWSDRLPAAGIVMGSSLGEDEGARIARSHTPHLIALGHILHTSLSGELLRLRAGAVPLSDRQRDCLKGFANGLRTGQVADRLGIREVTVNLHLRDARRKLAARNTPEAVAKALLYQQIAID